MAANRQQKVGAHSPKGGCLADLYADELFGKPSDSAQIRPEG